jgi:arylformamidase
MVSKNRYELRQTATPSAQETPPMTDPITPTAVDPVMEAAFVTDQRRAHWPATIAGFEATSADVARHPAFIGDIPYGPHPRRCFDRFVCDREPRGLLLYLHPGYWQMRDRSLFRCLMPVFAEMGLDVATVGYPLCPEVSVAELTEAVRDGVAALVADTRARRGRDLPILAAGHSAGGHLAVEIALTDWSGRGRAPVHVDGVVALSGVYDLEPLVPTSLNLALRLDAASARAASPIRHVGARGCPALFAVGGDETMVFRDQNRRMAEAWRTAGQEARVFESPGDDHFSLVTRLMEPSSPLHAAVADLVDRAFPAG